MTQAKNGDTVTVHFTGRLQDGRTFDTSKGGKPLSFTIGAGAMMPGFEAGVMGLKEGETKTFTVAPEEAYGPNHEKLTVAIDKSEFPEHIAPEVGQRIKIPHPEGGEVHVTITDVDGEQVTLDANHPLAGQTLTFDVEMVQISS